MLNTASPAGTGTMMSTASLKQTAHQIIDALPDDASWKDLIYEIAEDQPANAQRSWTD